jgi:hypothetical protein
VRKLSIAVVVLAAAIAPAAASAADPSPSDFKNAAKYCKALKKASGSSFASMFGTKKNAYGKCVSSTAKKQATEDDKQAKAAKTNAAKECKAERSDPGFAAAHDGKTFEQFYGTNKNGKNAYGKCVSTKAKAKKGEADDEDSAEQKDRVNAAKQCKAAKKDDPDAFADKYGSKRNAFGKCVSRTAKQLAAERKAA